MLPPTSDQIGRYAEVLAEKDLSRPVKGRYGRPLFRATPLVDKYPTVDFIVDALGADDYSLGFFFVQVKGTAEGATSRNRLQVRVPVDRFNQLVRIPAPTYLIGVDVGTESTYLVAAHRRRTAPVSSMTTAYRLADEGVIIDLYKEVVAFWKSNRPILQQTRFKDVP
jgi:hypothetical protein